MALGGAARVSAGAAPAAVRAGEEAAGARYPRVLVLAANPFTRRHNNGLFLSSLFEGWPPERLAQIYLPSVTPMAPMGDVCRRYWALTPLGMRADAVPAEGGGGREAAAAAERFTGARRLLIRATRPAWLHQATAPVREWVYGRPSLLRGDAMREVEAFAPDLVFSTLGTLGMLRLAVSLGKRLGVPVVPLFTDDWVTTGYRDVVLGGRMRAEMERLFRRVVSAAPVRLVGSSVMAPEYERRYGGEFLPFTRSVDAADYPDAPPPERAPGEPLELVYAGQVGAGRLPYLRRIGEALAALRAEGVRARLRVFCPPLNVELHGAELTLPPVMEVAGSVDSRDLPAVYQAADVLVHAESFEAAMAEYTRFSLSTKLSEYLMSGRPVLGFGPPGVGAMRHIAASGGGVVVGEDSDAALRAGLGGLLRDRAARLALGGRARAFALEVHEGSRQRERFRAALARAAAAR
jgi:glycosyltransferase involved in cell wall biosynthesis